MEDDDFDHGLSPFGIAGSIGKTLVLGGAWHSSQKRLRALDDLESIVIREAGIGRPWGELNIGQLCADFPNIRYIDVEYEKIADLKWISLLSRLEYIGVRCKSIRAGGLEAKDRPTPRSLNITGQQDLLNLINPQCKWIRIEGLKTKNLDFLELSEVEKLEIVRAPSLLAVDNASRLPRLLELSIYSAGKLTKIEPLFSTQSLRILSLQSCKKIVAPTLQATSFLEHLSLLDCGELATAVWIRRLPRLRYLRLSGTTVLDGRVAFLKTLKSIETLIVENKKNYDATFVLPSERRP